MRIDVGDDGPRPHRGAVRQHDTSGAATLYDDLPHRGVHVDADAMPGRGSGHRLGNCPHAADGMAPHALLAVGLTEDVVQQHIGGSWRVGTCEIADDRIEAEHGLDGFGLEPAVKHVASRFAEQPQRRGEAVGLPQPFADGGEPAQFARCVRQAAEFQVGRRLQNEAAQHRRDALDLGLVGAIARRIAGAELRDLPLGAAFPHEQMASVGQRQEVLDAAVNDAQPVLVEPQVADDFRLQQTYRVGCDRVAEAGMELLGNGRAADHAAPLQYAHPQAGHAEIGGAGEAVVASSDDDGVEIGHDGVLRSTHGKEKRRDSDV